MDLKSLIAKMDEIEKLSEASGTLDASSKIAAQIRKAITGLGTDEEAVYAAIGEVKDARQWEEIRKIYPEVDADILDDFSDLLAPELTHVKNLLAKIGVKLGEPTDPKLLLDPAILEKLKKLEELIDQWLELQKNKPSASTPPTSGPNESIFAEELIASFGYGNLTEHVMVKDLVSNYGMTLTEAAAAATMQVPAAPASGVWQSIKGFGGKVLSKVALPVMVLWEAWDAWQEIKALPTDLPESRYKAEVSKIVSRVVAQVGLFWAGAIIGAAIAGAITGPGAIVGFVAGGVGGLAASYALGDDVNSIVDAIVEKVYQATQKGKPPAGSQVQNTGKAGEKKVAKAQPRNSDPDIAELQAQLKADGYNLGTSGPGGDGVDGVLGKLTITAMQQDLIKAGAQIQATGVIDEPTKAAIQQYYLSA